MLEQQNLESTQFSLLLNVPPWNQFPANSASQLKLTQMLTRRLFKLVLTSFSLISRWYRKHDEKKPEISYLERITDIPKASQTLADILQIKFTLNDLIANDRLVQEKMSLRSLINEMEDEVLANAGIDVFEEVFKLIFTKLHDERLSGQGNNRSTRILEFRNTGQTEGALKTKVCQDAQPQRG
jgi:type I restriction enzyme M protein